MKKQRIYTGYAVVSRDILDDTAYKKGRFGVSFTDRSLDTCKRYCGGDRIVVRTYRIVAGRYLEFRWIPKYPHFGKSHRLSNPRYIQLWHLRIGWGVDYADGYEREIVYQNNTKEFILQESKTARRAVIKETIKKVTKDKESATKFLKSAGIMTDDGELHPRYK